MVYNGFPHLTKHERDNMRQFFADGHSKKRPNDPRAIFGAYESEYNSFRLCVLPQRDPILAEIAAQARVILSKWRARRLGKAA